MRSNFNRVVLYKFVNPALIQETCEQYPFIDLDRIYKMLCYLKISARHRGHFGCFSEYVFDKNALIFLSGHIPSEDILNTIDWNSHPYPSYAPNMNLLFALLSGRTEILEWLQKNKKVLFRPDIAPYYLLYALLSGSPKQADWINKKLGWGPGYHWDTAYYAALSGVPQQLEWLVKNLPDDLIIKATNRNALRILPRNFDAESIIHYAVASGNPEQVKKAIFYYYGAMPKQKLNMIKWAKVDTNQFAVYKRECEEFGPYDHLDSIAKISPYPDKMLPYILSLLTESKSDASNGPCYLNHCYLSFFNQNYKDLPKLKQFNLGHSPKQLLHDYANSSVLSFTWRNQKALVANVLQYLDDDADYRTCLTVLKTRLLGTEINSKGTLSSLIHFFESRMKEEEKMNEPAGVKHSLPISSQSDLKHDLDVREHRYL